MCTSKKVKVSLSSSGTVVLRDFHRTRKISVAIFRLKSFQNSSFMNETRTLAKTYKLLICVSF